MSDPDKEPSVAPEPPDESPEETPVEAPPVANPQAFKLRGNAPRVTRLSRKALALLGATTCFGIGGALVYALQPVDRPPAVNLVETEGRSRAETVTAAPSDYSKVPKLGQAMPGDLGRPMLSAQRDGRLGPSQSMTGAPDPRLTEAEQARQRLAQERESARLSQLFLGNTNDQPPQTVAPAAAAPSPMVQAQDDDRADATGTKDFLNIPANRTTVSSERVMAPPSANIVQAGSIIPAALLTGVQSDIPGQITAQVTQNVYDSRTGRILLIPQGARLIGEYDSQVSAGQNRVLLAWDRLIFPGGKSILLDRQPGADATGTAGIKDGVNYHWGNMLKAALVSTLLGVGTELATDNDDELVRALRYGSQDTINQTGRQLVQREIRVAPTLTVRPGHVLRVIVTRDLILEPLQEGYLR